MHQKQIKILYINRMGTNFTRIFGDIFKKRDLRVLMLGLTGAGKTVILYRLKMDEVVNSIPTIGFNVQNIIHGKYQMTIWDVGGNPKLIPLWRHYYQNTNGLIYVIDASDREQLGSSKEQLYKILQDKHMKEIPFVIMANKQDMATISIPELVQFLGLHKLVDKKWYIVGTCAYTGDGLQEGLEWLSKQASQSAAVFK